jgi:carbon storage regulator
MLVVNRRIGESIIIGDDVVVTVIANDSGGVSLGINAPHSIKVFRKELLTENQSADSHKLLLKSEEE